MKTINFKQGKENNRRKPSYWWDFSRDGKSIIIESDLKKFPTVYEIRITDTSAMKEINFAEKLICDLKEGRMSAKDLFFSEDEKLKVEGIIKYGRE